MEVCGINDLEHVYPQLDALIWIERFGTELPSQDTAVGYRDFM